MEQSNFSDALRELVADAVRDEVHAAVESAVTAALPAVIRRAKLPVYITKKELGALTGWSARKIEYLQAEGRLPFVRRGRTVLFRTDDVETYLDEGRVEAYDPR